MVVGGAGSRLRKTAGIEPWLKWIAKFVPELEAFDQASSDVVSKEVGVLVFVRLFDQPVRQQAVGLEEFKRRSVVVSKFAAIPTVIRRRLVPVFIVGGRVVFRDGEICA